MLPPPRPGSVVQVRRRHYLVSDIHKGERSDDATLVQLHCIDDDAPGESLEVLWQLELGTQIFQEDSLQIGEGIDHPRSFGAYLLALQWSCVTATDKDLFQAPFRAGIQIKPYQLEPLRKALDLPRVNLFIADDVGLGKTIEAGLVLQELLIRQRVERILVVCPPAVTLQWKEELEQRFGLGFAIYDRDWIAARRRERGWGINPWQTHSRFIISYPMLRGTEKNRGQHLELLINALGDRAPRSLLILDEVHQVAPASGTLYATDTRTTHAIRQLVNRFEHRIFLSATPHNGHSNSFSTLLEMLDPQRFTRGVKVSGAAELDPIMVRRLKRDLREEAGDLPERKLVDHILHLPPNAPEIQLGQLLARYETAYRASLLSQGVKDIDARTLVCINLHKRLLSSIVAFARTLDIHSRSAERSSQLPLALRPPTSDEDQTPEQRAREEEEWVQAVSFNPGLSARALLAELKQLADPYREVPDVRMIELARWIKANCIENGHWNLCRVVVFTEYDDTLQWINRHLPKLLGISCEDRIGLYTGGVSDQTRSRLKDAFNSDPRRYPLRILLCTDAGREGINLQAWCADLFHFDLPWNPSRVEQRNGRIDRTLQPARQVRCHYFDLPDRPEDRVLSYMVKKIHRIQEELGSLSDILSERLATRMETGIRSLDIPDIDRLTTPDQAALSAVAVLESAGQTGVLKGDLAGLARILQRSRKQMGWREAHLQQVVDQGLRLISLDRTGLKPADNPKEFHLPPLDSSWNNLINAMREPQPDGSQGPLRPVCFDANDRMDAPSVQLHLAHPLVRRILQRFIAPGWSSHDLNRITVLPAKDRLRRVICFARLVLFGPGASRLHEEVIQAAGQIFLDGSLKTFAEAGTERSLQDLADELASGATPYPDPAIHSRCRMRANQDYLALRSELDRLRQQAEATARTALKDRALFEAEAMVGILNRQETGILKAKEQARQQLLQFTRAAQAEREQFERDVKFMDLRLEAIAQERKTEPEQIKAAYQVQLVRFEPMGILYLWPVE
jgi:hypothetical protein